MKAHYLDKQNNHNITNPAKICKIFKFVNITKELL